MPLIMISGYPSSGKTTIAKELSRQLQMKADESAEKIGIKYKVEIINDESLGLAKETYRDTKTEKATRGAHMSAVKRALNKDTIVILDNLTYIKGFRYQLFCEAKAQTTNSCLVHVTIPLEMCKEFNSKHPDPWPQDLFDALVFRYEEPNGMNRWDSPLFIITHEDLHEIPIEEIWDSLILQTPKPPNQATVMKKATSGNYLFELDKVTQSIVTNILELQKVNPGGLVKVYEGCDKVQLPFSTFTLPQVQRMRRNFIALQKVKALDTDRIAPLFVEFLNKSFEQQ